MSANEKTWWALRECQTSRTAFSQIADVEFWNMRATREAAFVDAIQAATMATRNLGKKKAGRFAGVTTSWSV